MEEIILEEVVRMVLLIGFMSLIGYAFQEIYRKFYPLDEGDL